MASLRSRFWIWMSGVAGLAVICVWQFSSEVRIQTDLLAMLPESSSSETVKKLQDYTDRFAAKQVLFLITDEDERTARKAARVFSEKTAQSGVYSNLDAQFSPSILDEIKTFYMPYRFRLSGGLDGIDLDRTGLERRINTRLFSPLPSGSGANLAEDPYGILDSGIKSLFSYAQSFSYEDGFLIRRGEDITCLLIPATLNGSAFDPSVQSEAVRTFEEVKNSLNESFPSVRFFHTGTVFFASHSREQARREMNLVGSGSLIFVALLLLFVFRSFRHLLLGAACVLTGILTAACVTVAIFGKMDMLAVVAGASLVGVAVDYPMHYFAHHLADGQRWRPVEALKRISPGLKLGLLTSVLGYLSLLITPLPALRQIAVFSIAGLIGSFLTIYLLLPTRLPRPLTGPRFPIRWAAMLFSALRPVGRRSNSLIIASGIILFGALSLGRLQAKDDVRLLITPPADLVLEENVISEATGFSNSSQYYIVEGSTAEEVLRSEETLTGKLKELLKENRLTGYQAVSSFVPSLSDQERALNTWAGTSPEALAGPLRKVGFKEEYINGFLSEIAREGEASLKVQDWVETDWSKPFRHLWIGRIEGSYYSAVIPFGFSSLEEIRLVAEGLTAVQLIDRAGDVSRLFKTYRHRATTALGIAYFLVWLSLLPGYGWKNSIRLMTPVGLATVFVLAVVSCFSIPFNLFSVFSMILLLGIGMDYSIFLKEAREEEDVVFLGILLAAMTTLLSFGLLSFSSTPALKSLGTTLLIGIPVSLMLLPMAIPGKAGTSNDE